MTDAEWDEVWAAYDARHPRRGDPPLPGSLPARPAVPALRPARRRVPRRLALVPVAALAGWIGLAGLSALQAAGAVAGAAAWPVSTAQAGAAPAEPARHIDLAALQAGLRRDLAAAATAPAGTAGAAWLADMAGEVAEAWSRPAALAEVARLRGLGPGLPPGALGRLRWRGPAEVELPLGGGAAPVMLRLELKEAWPPRWQATELRLGTAAPEPSPGPAWRLAMR